MKRTGTYLILVLLLFAACDSGKLVNITYRDFGNEVTTTQNLTFEFNKSLADESMLNRWDSTPYIRFEPEIPGAFNWESPNRLVFSPTQMLPPATSVNGTVTDRVLAKTTGLSLGSDISFSFATTPLNIFRVAAYWSMVDETSTTPTPFMELEFNFPVPVKSLENKLSVEIGEKPVAITIDTEEEYSKTVKLHAEKYEPQDEVVPVRFIVQSGLTPLGGSSGTTDEKMVTANLNSLYQFKVKEVSANFDGSKGILTVTTSQAPQEEGFEKFIEISPKVDYDIERRENGFQISSESFQVSEKYEIIVREGMEGAVGGKMKGDYRADFSFGKVQPTIKFASTKTRFLSKKGYKNIKVQILNVPEVEVVVSKLYENNALRFLSSRDYQYDYNTGDYSYGFDFNRTEDFDRIWSKEISSADLQREGNFSILNLDFEDILPQFEGVYVVQVMSTEDRWLKDSKLISISDLGLIAKQGNNQVHVFVNSLATATPISGAEVGIIGSNNQKLQTTLTNGQGVAVFELDKGLPGGFSPRMVTVSHQGDYNLLDFGSTAVQTSRYEVGGKFLNDRNYEGFIFMERDLYRPGEQANLAVIVRDRQWGLPGEIPVRINVRTPDGKEFINVRKVLDEQGSTQTSFSLPASSLTGNYNVTVYTSNNQYLTSGTLKVEEFLPDRIKVTAKLDKEEYQPIDRRISLDISAVNFFGPPAANKNYQVRMQWSRAGFYPKDFRDYNFNYYKTNSTLYDATSEGVTDAEGKAQAVIDIPSNSQNTGIVNVNAFTTVFDETGRPVSVQNRARIYTQEVFYGLKSDNYWVKTGDLVTTNLIAVNKDGEVMDGQKAIVRVVKHEYKTVLARSGSYYRYRSERYERVVEDKEMEFNGKNTAISFIPDLSGRYEVRIFPPGVDNYISTSFYAYGWGSTTVNSFEVDTEGEVDIVFDKETYAPGENAQVILKAPFSGTALITVEADDVKDYLYVRTDNRSAQFSLPIKDSYRPNVFISATLIKPQELSDIPLTVAHGYAPIKVDKPENKLEIEIEAVEKSRSNQTQTLTFRTAPNAKLGVAVVDEGILQVSKYRTPDPYAFFYGKRGLEVSSYDIYPYLFPEVSGGLPGGGAGLASELASRVNPLNNERVKLVSYWKGIIETDGRGRAEHTIEIPQFSGDLRIMAIAFKDDAFGNAQSNMKVADPVVISPGIPRFLSPQDTLIMPVAVSNTEDRDLRADVSVATTGLLDVVGDSEQRAQLPKGQETMLSYSISTANDIGPSGIDIEVKAGGDTYTHHTDITVRPNSPLLKLTGSGVIKGAQTQSVQMEELNFIPSTVRRKLVVSKSPMTEFTKDFSYLLRYPYGCIEQTTSQGFPLLYFSDLSEETMDSDNQQLNANYVVNEVIKRIYLMQLYSGGFTYWPSSSYGRSRETYWGSVYATHFLVEAQRAGYEVDRTVLRKALEYLRKKANEKEVIDYYYTYTEKRPIYPRASLYALYVLALGGEPQMSTMNFYLSKQEFLTTDSKYLLTAAYVLAGDPSKRSSLIRTNFTPESKIRSTGGSFYSPLRDEAIALTALLDVDPTNPEIPVMAKHVSDALKGRSWYSTQERAFALIALGRIAREAANTTVTAEVKAGGDGVGSYNNSREPLTLADPELDGPISIETEGEGTLYYFWETQGISKDGSFVEEDNYIRAKRTFYREDGSVANLRDIQQNDRLIVKLSVSNIFSSNIENVVVTDMLPACFEIENPRFGELPNYRWVRDASTPDYSDFRDDRVHLFVDLYRGFTTHYYYVVRAVSKGTYNLGPVAADAMYNNEYHSYSGGGKVVVR